MTAKPAAASAAFARLVAPAENLAIIRGSVLLNDTVVMPRQPLAYNLDAGVDCGDLARH